MHVRQRFLEQLDLFRAEFRIEEALTRDISTGLCKAGNDAACDGVSDDCHNDWHCCGRLLSSKGSRRSMRHDHVDVGANEIGDKSGKPLIMSLRPRLAVRAARTRRF